MAEERGREGGSGLSRREALKLASGVAALGAALGVPASAVELLGQETGAQQGAYQLKFYRKPNDLLQTVDVNHAVAVELDGGRGPNGVAIHRVGDAVSFPFPTNMRQTKLPPALPGQDVRGPHFEVRFFTAKQDQTAALNDDISCLLEREGTRLEIRFFNGKEETRLELPAAMLQGKCRP